MLRGHCRLSDAAAARLVRSGRALDHLPALAEAHDAGLVSAEQVAVAAKAVTPERLTAAAAGVDLAVIDAVLTGVAVEQPHADLVQVVQHYLDDLDPYGPEPDPTEGRSLTLAKHADGSLPTLRGHRPQIAVVIDLADLVDPAGNPNAGRMAFGATVSAARTRWLACDGAVSRVVFGPDGAPLDLGREQRLMSRHIRKAAELRDGGCVSTGCGAPTWWCDVHHLVHWIDGGDTSLDNAALLCERHHTEVHHGFRVERRPAGRWRTWRPDGTEITTPAPLLSPAA
ncbi:DUF222 domain-containing protein [Geodermatophilus sp. SYSU D00698]